MTDPNARRADILRQAAAALEAEDWWGADTPDATLYDIGDNDGKRRAIAMLRELADVEHVAGEDWLAGALAIHPVDRCDLFRTTTGGCTCDTSARTLADLVRDVWPDPFGRWTADQAEAAFKMKGAILSALVSKDDTP